MADSGTEVRALGIVAALERELRPFSAGAGRGAPGAAPCDLGQGVRSLVSGVGPHRARAAALRLVESGAAALVSWGVAGGLVPDLGPGDLVLPREVLDSDGARWRVDCAWRDALADIVGGHPGPILSVGSSATSVDAKAELAASSGAIAIDMESAAVASIAAERGLSFLAVRVICDPARAPLPRSALLAVDERGRADLGRMLGCLLRRPADLPALIALGRAFAAACATQRELLRRAGPRLALPPGPVAAHRETGP